MKPVLQALVLAERVYQDVSGKKIIAGTFNRLLIGKMQTATLKAPDGSDRVGVPGGTDPGCPTAYISLTDVVDGTEVTLQMVNITKNVPLFHASLKINSRSRLDTVEIIAPLPPMTSFAREAGTLSLDVIWQGEILGSHRLVVAEAEQDTQGS